MNFNSRFLKEVKEAVCGKPKHKKKIKTAEEICQEELNKPESEGLYN